MSKLVEVDNWGSYLLKQMSSFYNQNEHCDLFLICNNKKFHVHRAIIIASCGYFRKIPVKAETVVLPNKVSIAALEAIIRFIYTGKMEILDENKRDLTYAMRLMEIPILPYLIHSDEDLKQENDAYPTKSPSIFKGVKGRYGITYENDRMNSSSPKKMEDITKPLRFELPESSQIECYVPSFEDVSYTTEPLMKELELYSDCSKLEETLRSLNDTCTNDTDGGMSPDSFDKHGDMDSVNMMDDENMPFISNSSAAVRGAIDETMDWDDDDRNDHSVMTYASSNPVRGAETINDSDSVVPAVTNTIISSVTVKTEDVVSTQGEATGSCDTELIGEIEEGVEVTKDSNKENSEAINRENVEVANKEKNDTTNKENNEIANKDNNEINNEDNNEITNKDNNEVASKGGNNKDTSNENTKDRNKGNCEETNNNGCKTKESETTEENVDGSNKATLVDNEGKESSKEEEKEKENSNKDKKEDGKESTIDKTEIVIVEKKSKSADKGEKMQNDKTVAASKQVDLINDYLKDVSPNKIMQINFDKFTEKNPAIKDALSKLRNVNVNNSQIRVSLTAIAAGKDPNNISRLYILEGNKNDLASKEKGLCIDNKLQNTPNRKPLIHRRITANKPKINLQTEKAEDELSIDNTDGPWNCSACGTDAKPISFTTYYKFRQHIHTVHKRPLDFRYCEYCGYKSLRRNVQLYHLYTKHDIPPPTTMNFPKCTECEYIALSVTMLNKHTKHHRHLFACSCRAAFSDKHTLEQHILVCRKDAATHKQKYKCSICNTTYDRYINLKAHVRISHKNATIFALPTKNENSSIDCNTADHTTDHNTADFSIVRNTSDHSNPVRSYGSKSSFTRKNILEPEHGNSTPLSNISVKSDSIMENGDTLKSETEMDIDIDETNN